MITPVPNKHIAIAPDVYIQAAKLAVPIDRSNLHVGECINASPIYDSAFCRAEYPKRF